MRINHKAAQIMAMIRSGHMINIGGRPVLVPTPRKSATDRSRAYSIQLALAFVAIYIIWGSAYLAIRYAVETIPPLVTAGIRHSIAGTILLAWAWARGFRPTRAHWLSGLVVGALFFLIGHGTLHWAEQYVGSGLAALLLAPEPMFILALAWSVGVVISPKLKLPSDALGRTALPTICGAVMLLAAAALTGEFHATHWAGISSKSILGLAYLIVFGSVVAFTAYTWLLQRCPPAIVATHTYANPVVAVFLGWLLASEPLTMRVVLASVAILGAIVLIRKGERTSAVKGPEVVPQPAEVQGSEE